MQKRWLLKSTMPSGRLDKTSLVEAEVVASTIEEAEVQAEEILEAVVGAEVVKEDEVAAVDLVEVIHATHVEKQVTTVETARRKMLSASTVERSVMLSLLASTKRMKLHACRERECAQGDLLLSVKLRSKKMTAVDMVKLSLQRSARGM